MIDFGCATEAQLVTLAAACEPASFGIAKKDVIDESYRKAGKMDPSEFAMQFSPTSSGIIEGVRKSLFSNRTTESIKVELYKLNVYGTSSNSDPFLLLHLFQDLGHSLKPTSTPPVVRAWSDRSLLFSLQSIRVAHS